MPEPGPVAGPGTRHFLVAVDRSGVAMPYRLTLGAAALTCALTPAYTVRWKVGFYPTTLLELAILVTVGIFVYETLRRKEPIAWHTPFTWPALLLLLAAAIDVIVAADRRAALGLFRAYFVEPMAFFLVVISAVRRARDAFLLAAGLGVAALVAGLANAVVILDAIRRHTIDLSVAPPVVIYQSTNSLALFLVPIVALGAALAVYSPDRRQRLLSAWFLVLAVIATILSFSRGGYLALAAVSIGLAVSHRWRRLLLPSVLILGLAATRVPIIATRLSHELNFSDPYNTLSGRFQLWQATISYLRHHPIFGFGLGGFEHTVYAAPTGLAPLVYPHNIVLNFWTSTGILGVIAFTWLLVQVFRVTWRGWRTGNASWRPYHLGVMLAMVAIVVHGIVDVPYFKNDLSLEFWALLGLTWAATRWAENDDRLERPTGPRASTGWRR